MTTATATRPIAQSRATLLSWYNGFSPAIRLIARQIRQEAIESGKIPAPTRCQACLQEEGVIEYHLEDYNRPLEGLIQLCRRCHLQVHCRFRGPDGWARYRAMVRDGYRFAPAASLEDVRQQLAGAFVVAVRVNPPRPHTILDGIESRGSRP